MTIWHPEVGHSYRSGQIYSQGAKLVNEAIKSGKMFEGSTWKQVTGNANARFYIALLGLFSDGNVHSLIIKSYDNESKKQGIERVRVHILLDGRDR